MNIAIKNYVRAFAMVAIEAEVDVHMYVVFYAPYDVPAKRASIKRAELVDGQQTLFQSDRIDICKAIIKAATKYGIIK